VSGINALLKKSKVMELLETFYVGTSISFILIEEYNNNVSSANSLEKL
jgi:hypothetical protein